MPSPIAPASTAPPHPALLIFDLDGTLIDSRDDLVACVNKTLQHLHRPTLPEAQIAGFIGDGAAALVRRSLEVDGGCSEQEAQAGLDFFLDYYRHHLLDHTTLYPGVLQVLAQFRSADPALQMAVLTNKPVAPSRRICEALGLAPFLFANYGGNSFATKKPDSEGLLAIWAEAQILRGESLTADRIVLIGDSEVDVRTARNAVIRVIGCTWGFATAKLLAEAPDMLADRPEDWSTRLNLSVPAAS